MGPRPAVFGPWMAKTQHVGFDGALINLRMNISHFFVFAFSYIILYYKERMYLN